MSLAPKRQRSILVAMAVVAIAAAALLALWGLQDRAAYFVTPSDIASGTVPQDQPLRLGGMVVDGSIERRGDGTVAFRLADQRASVDVTYAGITPDLFVEGSGAVAEGRIAPGGHFEASRILAKHDENYMPPELAGEEADSAATVAE